MREMRKLRKNNSKANRPYFAQLHIYNSHSRFYFLSLSLDLFQLLYHNYTLAAIPLFSSSPCVFSYQTPNSEFKLYIREESISKLFLENKSRWRTRLILYLSFFLFSSSVFTSSSSYFSFSSLLLKSKNEMERQNQRRMIKVLSKG